jgi:hypothetical protein
MNLLPLSLFVFSLLAGNGDMGDQTSDVKGEIISRYKDLQVEEMDHEEESIESEEDLI